MNVFTILCDSVADSRKDGWPGPRRNQAAPVQLHFFDRAQKQQPEPGRAPERFSKAIESGAACADAAFSITRGTLAVMFAIAVFHVAMFAIGKVLSL